jgi:long-chain acyl-CoA synthetase
VSPSKLDAVREVARRLTGRGAVYELQRRLIAGVEYICYARAPASLTELYRRAVSMRDAPLVVLPGRRLTFADGLAFSSRLACSLKTLHSVSPGTRVGLAIEDPILWTISFLAVTSLGATAVLVGHRTAEVMQHCVRVAQCTLLIVAGSQVARSVADDLALPVFAVDDRQVTRRARGTADPRPAIEDLNSLDRCEATDALIAFTSGSTGPPKAVLSTHRAVIAGLMNMTLAAAMAGAREGPKFRPVSGRRPTPSTVVLSSMNHISGYGQLLLALYFGRSILALPRWHADDVMELINREGASHIVGASSTQIGELFQVSPSPGSLVGLGLSGAAVSSSLVSEVAERWPGVTLSVSYGMTETNGSICSISGESLRRRPQFLGVVVPTVDVRVVNESGSDVAQGQSGEIWLRGVSLMSGYCSKIQSDPGIHDGWFPTGDWGSISADRQLNVFGRLREVVRVNGATFTAADLEAIALALPELADVAAVSLAPPTGSGTLIAAVLKPTCRMAPGEVMASIEHHFASAGIRVSALLMPRLPRTVAGKVDGPAIRAEFDHRLASIPARTDGTHS